MGGLMNPFTLVLTLLFLSGLVSNAQAAETERPAVARYGKVYRGGEGVTISVLSIGKTDDEEYLLQYSGINSDWNWKIFKAKKVPAGTGFDYVIQFDGRDYATMIERGSSGYARSQVFVPKVADGVHVGYDESLSQRIIPEHYLTDYLEQESGKPVRGAA
jgi:hypothetical protein